MRDLEPGFSTRPEEPCGKMSTNMNELGYCERAINSARGNLKLPGTVHV